MKYNNHKYVKLTEVCDILDKYRKPVKKEERGEEIYPYYGANGIQGFIENYIFDDKLVLLAEDGGHFCSKTKPIAYKVEGKCWVNNHAHVLKAKSIIDTDFLCFSLMFYDVSKLINGTTRQKLNQNALNQICLLLPPLSQQQEIVQLLDKSGEMIELRKKQLATLDTLAESVFYQMFGDPVTNEKGWEMKRLGEFASVITGPFGSMLHVYDYIDGGVPLINPMHIVGNKIKKNNQFSISQEKANELIKYVLEINDIIMARRGEIGRCAVVGLNENGYLCGTGSLRIRPIDLPSTYLHYFIQTTYSIDYLKNNAKGATMLNLNSKIVKNMPILLPPLALQQEFAAIVEKIEEEKALAQTALKQSEDLFQRLMQDLFPSPSSQASVVERNHLEAVQTTI